MLSVALMLIAVLLGHHSTSCCAAVVNINIRFFKFEQTRTGAAVLCRDPRAFHVSPPQTWILFQMQKPIWNKIRRRVNPSVDPTDTRCEGRSAAAVMCIDRRRPTAGLIKDRQE